MCNTKPIKRYEIIEVIVPLLTAGQLAFPDVPNLRNTSEQQITIQDIEFFPNYAYGASFLNTAVVGTPIGEIPKIAMVLYVAGEESIRSIPLAKINYSENLGIGATFSRERVPFDNLQKVDWPKSYFKFNAALVGLPYIIPLGVTYLKFGGKVL